MENNGTIRLDELSEVTSSALKNMGFEELSDVQKHVIPEALKGRDIFIHSHTGSGKTAAYLVPVLERLELQGAGKHYPAALILVPTRELGLQVTDTCRKLLEKREGIRTVLLCGGTDMQKQIKVFSKGADIVIATPARLLDHIRRHTFKPKMCRTLILDEADVMLSMGFREDVMRVIETLPEHQTILASATLNEAVEQLRETVTGDPYEYSGTETSLVQSIRVEYTVLAEARKPDALFLKLRGRNGSCIVFCNTIRTAQFVTGLLNEKNIPASVIHSELMQYERRNTIDGFRNGTIRILVSTDLAARGIDIPAVETVINYDWPQEDAVYIHRIGRTARAGNTGTAITFLTPKEKAKSAVIQANADTEPVLFTLPASGKPKERKKRTDQSKTKESKKRRSSRR